MNLSLCWLHNIHTARPKKGCVSQFEWSTMILRCLYVFYGRLKQNLHNLNVYSGVPSVNETHKMWVDTPESCHTVCLIFGRVVAPIFPSKKNPIE